MPRPLPRPPADDEPDTASLAVDGLLSHLDAVYGFAFVLTGDDTERAESLTEQVFASVHDDLWSTLGGRSLRDRLLARSVTAYREASAHSASKRTTPRRAVDPSPSLRDLMLDLPWQERAAIALVDQLGLKYEAGAAVLGTDVNGFRELLHRGRSVLFDAHRALAR